MQASNYQECYAMHFNLVTLALDQSDMMTWICLALFSELLEKLIVSS